MCRAASTVCGGEVSAGGLACLWMCGVERRGLGLDGAHHQRFEGNKADARCTQPCEGAGGTWQHALERREGSWRQTEKAIKNSRAPPRIENSPSSWYYTNESLLTHTRTHKHGSTQAQFTLPDSPCLPLCPARFVSFIPSRRRAPHTLHALPPLPFPHTEQSSQLLIRAMASNKEELDELGLGSDSEDEQEEEEEQAVAAPPPAEETAPAAAAPAAAEAAEGGEEATAVAPAPGMHPPPSFPSSRSSPPPLPPILPLLTPPSHHPPTQRHPCEA